MSRETTLQAELTAITARKAKLDEIAAYIQRMQDALDHLNGERRKQAEDIHAKAKAVYAILLAAHQYEDAQNTNLHRNEKIDQCITATANLLTAKPGKEREGALAEFLVLANELSGHPSKEKQRWGIAMIALGVALVGVAVAITVCLCMGPAAWPFFVLPAAPVETGIGSGFAVLLHGLLAKFAHDGYVFGAGTLAAWGLFSGLFSITSGAGRLTEGLGNKNRAGPKMVDLHGSFFRATPEGSKEVTSIVLVPESNAIPDGRPSAYSSVA